MRWLLLTCALASTAWADDEEPGQDWSLVGARTVPPKDNLLEAELGYPASVSYLRGVLPGVNVGGRAGFIYAIEGLTRDIAPGFKGQVLFRLRFFDAGKLSLGLTFEPGFFIASATLQGLRSGLNLPLGLRLGIAASSAFAIGVQLEVPVWFEFGPYGGFNFPILTGGGVEYFITSNLALFVKARLGPTIRVHRPAEVVFDASVGIGYRFGD